MKDVLQELAASPKAAQLVAMTTTGTGMGTVFEWIPSDIGKLATLIGIVLSSILIYKHSMLLKQDSEKNKLELEILKEKRREQVENAEKRAAVGEPVRRDYDELN